MTLEAEIAAERHTGRTPVAMVLPWAYHYGMASRRSPPTSVRFSPADQAVLAVLTARTGLTVAGVLRLAMRLLVDDLAALRRTAPKPRARRAPSKGRKPGGKP